MSQTSKSPLSALDEVIVGKNVDRVVNKPVGKESNINLEKVSKGDG